MGASRVCEEDRSAAESGIFFFFFWKAVVLCLGFRERARSTEAPLRTTLVLFGFMCPKKSVRKL